MSGYSSGAMIIHLEQDPRFYYGGYPESGTEGYNGPGWYVWNHRGINGPYKTEQEAKKNENTSSD